MPFIQRPSPNYSNRHKSISAVVIHDTAAFNVESTLNWFESVESKVSAHFVVDHDGTIYQCVDIEDKAWHAGASALHGEENVNEFSIGIELVDANDNDPYRDEQIGALISLTTALCHEYKIPLNRVVGHCHISPGRKIDPGKDFPWFDFLAVVGARVSELQLTFEDVEIPK